MSMVLPQLGVVKAVIERTAASGSDLKSDLLNVEAVGLWGSAKTLAAVQAAQALGHSLLCIAPNRIEAEAIYDDLATFAGPAQCALFPPWEVLPTDAMAPTDDIVAERMNTLERLLAAKRANDPMYVAAPVRALLQCVPAPDCLTSRMITLAVGEAHDLEGLLAALVDIGYERELLVEQRGQVSVRGGILDVFPISTELPYRVEFFGEEVESIRRFEPETQRSVEQARSVCILPRSEKAMLPKQRASLASLTDYFPKTTLVAMDEPRAIMEQAARTEAEVGGVAHFFTWREADTHLRRFPRMSLAQVAYPSEPGAERFTMSMMSMTAWQGHAEEFWHQLERWDADRYTVLLLCNNTGQRRRLMELLEEHGYRPRTATGANDAAGFDLRVEIGPLRAGFASPDDRLAVLSEREMFGRRALRRVRRRFELGDRIVSFGELRVGDYVVHAQHGIGRYVGLKQFPGQAGDFLTIQYRGGDKLYVPVTHIDSVQKYSGGDGGPPKVDKLGGVTWARTKARVKKAVRDMTQELLQLYAAREARQGHAFSPDTPWQQDFEDAFEYDETPDQDRAIAEVKRDMEQPKPMDRLICGDVGFGKTEVAIRAAFKAVTDGKQVAVLVPTTVLAEQHYVTFTQRLADYPVKVEMLSRFRSVKEQQATIERLKSGEVDIVIGTHRLVSKDVQFRDLGLIVIDEEHRFGVAQKEKLKQLRTVADVLTLTATPIPRTLNLSLLGVRDMSIINTAPNDRLPIHTCIDVFDERLIAEAVRRELARQGQVFFVHNRVQTIMPFARLILRLVPDARVAVAHGQMPERELEAVMAAFVRRDLDVLVCTTIIGSGLDIPNANTIIIHNADRFGLADLYQLRGRVGRYKHRAFAYLLVDPDRALSQDAQNRLKALEEFSTLGSGFRLAMRDLEIRGCGNILGAEQHGHMVAVGYDTYMELVAETVAELKGEPICRRVLPPVEIAVNAYIPEEYVASEAQRITLYKRISALRTVAEADEMLDELRDRFGALPGPVRSLLEVMRVRVRAAELGVKRIIATKNSVTMAFESPQLLTRKNRHALLLEFGKRLQFSWAEDPSITYEIPSTSPDASLEVVARLLRLLADL